MKKTILYCILAFFILGLSIEAALRLFYGAPQPEQDYLKFRYQYIDIYERFFSTISRGKERFFVSQRRGCNYGEFPARKAPEAFRVFIIGESAAQGINETTLRETLASLVPERRFEVINCGMGAYDSYRIYLVMREIASYQPDLVVVLCGNNAFMDKEKVFLWAYYTNRLMRRSLAYCFLQDGLKALYARKPPCSNSLLLSRRLAAYEKNLCRIIRIAKSHGIPLLLCTLPANFRDCPPSADVPEDRDFIEAKFFLEGHDYNRAAEGFSAYVQKNPAEAVGWYFLGRAFDAKAQYSQAKECYLRALDMDFGNRAGPSSNAIVRNLCREYRVGLADLAKAFESAVANGLCGREQFIDYCHWYLKFGELVISVMLKAVSLDRPYFRIALPAPEEMSLYPACGSIIGTQEKAVLRDEVILSLRLGIWEVMNSQVREEKTYERAVAYFQTLYSLDPAELWNIQYSREHIRELLRENNWLAEWDQETFDRKWPRVLFHVGEAYRRLGLFENALGYLDQSISLDGTGYTAYISRALTYYFMRNIEKAEEDLARAQRQSGSTASVVYYRELFNSLQTG